MQVSHYRRSNTTVPIRHLKRRQQVLPALWYDCKRKNIFPLGPGAYYFDFYSVCRQRLC